jgi:CHAD domain-containing protein
VPRADASLRLEEPGPAAAAPPRLAAALSGVVREQKFVPIAELATHRSQRRVDGAEVTIDHVEAMDDHRVVRRFTEVEAELVDGPTETLDRIEGTLRELGARPGDGKLEVLRVVEVPERGRAGAKASALEALRVMVGAQYDELRRHDPIVRLSDDPEAVHKMRVAVRRLRSVLRTARPMLDEAWVGRLRDELDWLADRLGAVRDLDVLIGDLGAEAEHLPDTRPAHARKLLRPLEAERTEARKRLRECLELPRYHRLLDSVEEAADAPRARRDDLKVEQLARKDFRRLRKSGRRLDSQTDAELHKTRIRGKRARYAAELAESSRGKKATRFVKATKELQDVLGEHQDAVVAVERLHDLARHTGSTNAALLAGRLIERQEQRKRDARHDLPTAWRKVARRGKRAWPS